MHDAEGDDRLAPGTVVAERYRILDSIGEGGMGAVYRAEHVHMRKAFALKVLHADMSKNAEIVARFEREAIAAGHIAHPNVAAATDFGRLPNGSFFLVLEFVDGKNLRGEMLAGAFDGRRAAAITLGIAHGVSAAHAKGIVHRDLKPENVMLVERDGDPDFVKVLDFGIAKVDVASVAGSKPDRAGEPLTKLGAVFGTPDYMAPEQALGEAIDHRADLYAVGTIAYEMLAGHRPFEGEAVAVLSQRVTKEAPALPGDVLARVDPRFVAAVMRLLAREPAGRFASAADTVAALEPILAAAPMELAPASRAAAPPGAVQAAFQATVMAAQGAVVRARAMPRRRFVTAVASMLAALLAVSIFAKIAAARSPVQRMDAAAVPAQDKRAVELTIADRRTGVKDAPTAPNKAPADKRGDGGGHHGFYIPPPSQWFK